MCSGVHTDWHSADVEITVHVVEVVLKGLRPSAPVAGQG
jgi:hypothetical protein